MNHAICSGPATLEVLFSPAEFEALRRRDLSQTTCVVFDVLRATSSMVTALGNGATAIIPVAEISEALDLHSRQPDVLLAGERDGLRIRSNLTGSVDFDFGNSPREFSHERVQGKTIIMTTTNGTRALRACVNSSATFVGAFLNLTALAAAIRETAPRNLLVICSGTYEESSYEDTLGAGALCDALWPLYEAGEVADSAQIARQIFLSERKDLTSAIQRARNGRRLLTIPGLAADVPFCLQTGIIPLVPRLHADGRVTVT
ncbi:MAG: 2-phosphosulfolactate phosphatase [Pedosphaera sp.]|nr:2-phosphosulfolactate phosphatase [Pedosphaera sp.]